MGGVSSRIGAWGAGNTSRLALCLPWAYFNANAQDLQGLYEKSVNQLEGNCYTLNSVAQATGKIEVDKNDMPHRIEI